APTGHTPRIRYASPSESSSSGEKVWRASRAPMAGMVPKALAKISPLSRNASAHATTQTSARVTAAPVPVAGESIAWSYRRLLTAVRHGRLVVRLRAGKVTIPERLPGSGAAGRRRVLPLKVLVPVVVRGARGEVRPVGCFHHARHQ